MATDQDQTGQNTGSAASATANGRQASIAALLKDGRLESIAAIVKKSGIGLHGPLLDGWRQQLRNDADLAMKRGDIRQGHRLDRRAMALSLFIKYGLDPDRLIPSAVLAPGYCGKFLLVAIRGEGVGDRVCLRSGDLWHREILKDTIEEMEDAGFESVSVEPVGGALVRFTEPEEIVIHGSSDEFGTCHKKTALKLIAGLYPKKKIRIHP